jgi:hypothetical protein
MLHHLDYADDDAGRHEAEDLDTLPRLALVDGAGRPLPVTGELTRRGLTIGRAGRAVMATWSWTEAPLSLGLTLDAGATRPLSGPSLPGRPRPWGVRSVYRA